MVKFLTKEQAEVQKQNTAQKEAYYFGEIHPYIFTPWDDENCKKDIIYILITHLGKYELNKTVFKKAKCPICGEEELSVYSCCASILNGANVLKGYCNHCNKMIAFEDSTYYHMIRDYIMNNSENLKPIPYKKIKYQLS